MKTTELKAEPMNVTELDRWLAGKMPRRILVAPFGGPIGKAGFDVDIEYFDETTDFYGPYPKLRQTRDRLVDFHHTSFLPRAQVAAERAIKGAIMGRVELADEPEEVELDGEKFAGIWGDFWANAGEKRRQLIAWLERRGHPLYGSSQPIAAGVVKAGDVGARNQTRTGHIEVWPILFHTITTSPQNTYAVVPPLKAVLDAPDATEVSVAALRALAVDLDDLGDLAVTSAERPGDERAKSGRVGPLIGQLDEAMRRLREAAHPDTGDTT